LRRFCAEVHAFEPQRILFNMLAGSIALNGWLNVYCYNVALGQGEGEVEIPQYDYNKPLSFGSIEFDGVQKEPLTQSRGKSDRKEFVPLKLLDDYRFRRIDVLKIDVEGMELAVLAGAYETIQRCRPVLFIEHAKSVKAVLQSVIESLGYVVEEHGTMDFICLPLD
jgi:FkbM family methyltransferase